MEDALNVPCDVQVAQDLLEDLRDRHFLEDAALGTAREQPGLRRHLDTVTREGLIAAALRYPHAYAVEVPLLAPKQFQFDGYGLANEFFEVDPGSVLGNQLQVELEES